MSNKIPITQKEIDDIYEVEQELTQPKIEDNIDKLKIKDEPEFLTEEELEQDKHLEESIGWVPEPEVKEE